METEVAEEVVADFDTASLTITVVFREKVKKEVDEVEKYDFVPLIWDESKVRKRAREGGKDRDTKSDEERRREWAVANRHGTNDTTFGVKTPNKNNKSTKTKQNPRTSKQFNWKCWMLQVCGWLGLLAMIYPLLNGAPDSFSFCIHYYML